MVLRLFAAIILSTFPAHAGEATDVPGGVRTSFGTTIHPSCFKMFKDNDKAGVVRAFSQNLRKSYELIDTCAKRYPQLQVYTNAWKQKMSATTFSCTPSMSGNSGAINVYGYISTTGLKKWGIDPEYTKDLPKIVTQKNPLIIFSGALGGLKVDDQNGFYDPGYRQGGFILTLIHEGFHSTGANNRADHNTIESKGLKWKKTKDGKITLENPCDDNLLDDRISVLDSICTDAAVNIQNSSDLSREGVNPQWNASGWLAMRIGQCGIERGCEKVFNQAGHNESFINRLLRDYQPIATKDAHALCESIQEFGKCDMLRFNPDQLQSIGRNNPEYKKIQSDLEKFWSENNAQPEFKMTDGGMIGGGMIGGGMIGGGMIGGGMIGGGMTGGGMTGGGMTGGGMIDGGMTPGMTGGMGMVEISKTLAKGLTPGPNPLMNPRNPLEMKAAEMFFGKERFANLMHYWEYDHPHARHFDCEKAGLTPRRAATRAVDTLLNKIPDAGSAPLNRCE